MTPHEPPDSDALRPTSRVERIERFQALEPGVYWRALHAVTVPNPHWSDHPLTIAPGTVLLLIQVHSVDDVVHSVSLRYHPLEGDGEYRILVAELLANFEPALDAEEVRARELASLRQEITDIETELSQAQRDSTVLTPAIQKGLKAWEKTERDRRRRQGGHAPSRASGALVPTGETTPTSVSDAIAHRLTAADADTLQHRIARDAQVATLRAEWITARTKQIAEKFEAMAPFYAERVAVDLARAERMQEYAKKLLAGLESLSLYNGTGVDTEQLTEGAEAPPEEPLTLCQRKLFMDEELAAWADIGEAFDFDDVPNFDRALRENTSLREQLFPTTRCVLSIAIRRHDVDYGDAWANAAANARNRQVFLLVRNGERIHRVYSAEPSHENTPRLFPTRTELGDLFTGLDGETITFADLAYPERHQAAEDLALHYRRFLILLAGLDHRLHLFGPFYDPREASHFISLDFQTRHFRFLADDEPARALGEGRPPVLEWIRSRNEYLQSGSRVLCRYASLLTAKSAPACRRTVYHGGHEYTNNYAEPLHPAEVRIVYREHGHLFVDVPVKRITWRETRQPTFNAKLQLDKAPESSKDGFGYLCLDAVQASDLDWYVHDRASRIHHGEYVRLFKITAATLHAEEAEETPTRAYLQAAALEARVASASQLPAVLEDSIRTWRCAHRGQALPPVTDKPALAPILNHLYAVRHQQDAWLHRLDAHAGAHGYVPLKAALTGTNRLALYTEVPANERTESLVPWRWVRRITLAVRKTVLTETSSRLVWLQDLPDARERELRRWPALDAWLNEGPEPLRLEQVARTRQLIDEAVTDARTLFTGPGAGMPPALFASLLDRFRHALYNAPGRTVPTVFLAVPIGAYIPARFEASTLTLLVVSDRAERWLRYFADPEQQAQIDDCYIRIHRNHDAARERLAHPFRPRLAALSTFPRHPIDVVTHIAYPTHLDLESNHTRPPDPEAALTRWITATRDPKNPSLYGSTPPPWFMVHPSVWDGTRAHLVPFGTPASPSSTDTP